jgi:ABC-type branched-subunit amino acid transport system ATPase component
MKRLETIDLTAGYKRSRQVIKDISLTLERGEIIGLFGTNGAGKSTVLKAIMGLLYETRGEIRYYPEKNDSQKSGDSGDVCSFSELSRLPVAARSKLGIRYLTQDSRVFPSLSAKRNLDLAMRKSGQSLDFWLQLLKNDFQDLVDEDRLEAPGYMLSGGERASIAMAMVLISGADLLLLDEPSAGMAPKRAASLFAGIRDYVKKTSKNTTVILIEQQRLFAAKNICDSIYLMKNGHIVDCLGNNSMEKIQATDFSENDLENFMLGE